MGSASGTVCYVGVMIPEGEGAILGQTCPTSLIPLIIENWTGPCSGTQQGQMRDCKLWTSLLSAAKGGVKFDIWDCFVVVVNRFEVCE